MFSEAFRDLLPRQVAKYALVMSAPLPSAELPRRLREQAIELIRANRPQAACEVLENLLRLQPQDVPASMELASLMASQGRFRDSGTPLLKAMQYLPRHGPILLALSAELIARGEVVAARECLDFLAQLPAQTDALVQQARLRYGLGEFVAARDLFHRALKAGADAPDVHLMHAVLLEFTGNADAAEASLETCIARWPTYGDAAVALIRMRRQVPQNNRLDYVEEQLHTLSSSNGGALARLNTAAFEYVRFKILDDLGRYEEAWPSLVRSNQIMREFYPYDAAAEQDLTQALVDMPLHQNASYRAPSETGLPIPVFIVGLPRSGTTLLDRMLSAHSKVISAGELYDFEMQLHWVANQRPAGVKSLRSIVGRITHADLEEVGRRYLEHTRWRADGRVCYVNKLPANIRMVACIRSALPQARILNMVREPMDVCFSNYKLFGNTSTYIHDLSSIADYHRQHLRLCARWRELGSDMMLDVPYAELVRDPRATMQRVLAYCGLDLEEACLHPEGNTSPVATPSTSQVREPIHSRSIGQWRTYASQLEPLRAALA